MGRILHLKTSCSVPEPSLTLCVDGDITHHLLWELLYLIIICITPVRRFFNMLQQRVHSQVTEIHVFFFCVWWKCLTVLIHPLIILHSTAVWLTSWFVQEPHVQIVFNAWSLHRKLIIWRYCKETGSLYLMWSKTHSLRSVAFRVSISV